MQITFKFFRSKHHCEIIKTNIIVRIIRGSETFYPPRWPVVALHLSDCLHDLRGLYSDFHLFPGEQL